MEPTFHHEDIVNKLRYFQVLPVDYYIVVHYLNRYAC